MKRTTTRCLLSRAWVQAYGLNERWTIPPPNKVATPWRKRGGALGAQQWPFLGVAIHNKTGASQFFEPLIYGLHCRARGPSNSPRQHDMEPDIPTLPYQFDQRHQRVARGGC